MEGELTKFLAEREEQYRKLEVILQRAESRGLKKFTRDDLLEFGRIYRIAAADLARARFVLRSPILAEYLNDLVGRAHHLIHRRQVDIIGGFFRFIRQDFPGTVRREIRVVLFATIIMSVSILIGGFAYSSDPEWGQLIWDKPMLRQYARTVQEEPESLLASAIDEQHMAAASAYIISNNVRACIIAAAGGILFGIGTLLALSFNGFLLGIVGVMFMSQGSEQNMYFWSGILPHGVLEIPAICIAGSAGFIFARSILIPGKLSRGDSLRVASKNSIKLLGGVFFLLLIAGLIEGFITPMDTTYFPEVWKIIFAFALFAGFIVYLWRSGRRDDQFQPEPLLDRTTTHIRLD